MSFRVSPFNLFQINKRSESNESIKTIPVNLKLKEKFYDSLVL